MAERLPVRWFRLHVDISDPACVAYARGIIDRAAATGVLNGLLLDTGAATMLDTCASWDEPMRERVRAIKRHSDAKGIEVIPVVWSMGYGSPLSVHPELAEGLPAKGVCWRRQGARGVFVPDAAAFKAFNDRFGVTNIERRARFDVPPTAFLNRKGTPRTVRDAQTGVVYEEGRDVVISKRESPWSKRGRGQVLISFPETSRVPEGGRILIDGYVPAVIGWDQYVVCMSAPETFDHVRTSAAAVAELLDHPRTWQLAMDETRAGGTCETCRETGLDMPHIFAKMVAAERAAIRTVVPEAEVLIWSDMIDPLHNAKTNRYFLCAGGYAGTRDLMPKDLTVNCWWRPDPENSVKGFADAGFPTVATTYYDSGSMDSARRWLAAGRAVPGFKGLCYGTWANDYRRQDFRFLEEFAELFEGRLEPMLGVNYYAFSGWNYQRLKELGRDVKAEIRRDVAHFRRIGFGAVRIHCLDRQLSMPDGRLVANKYLDAQDFLVAECAKAGLKVVFTPISWWSGRWDRGFDGFSHHYTMKQLTSDPAVWEIEARYLAEFVAHLNPYTGFRIGEDPAVLAFECINEPVYPEGLPDATVAAFAERLAKALRTGTAKPVYYNSWHGRNRALAGTSLDGVTGSCYPTGIQAGRALYGSQLGLLRQSTFVEANVPPIPHKQRMIYEFDAADTPGSYLYPAFAKLFRSEGVDVAHVFAYDELALADENRVAKTHYLNLVYTPRKAISAAIAAEAMRRVPKGEPYVPAVDRMDFPPFSVSAADDLAVLNAPEVFMHSNTTTNRPVDPRRLRRVYGVGTSPVAGRSGLGTYFLDHLAYGRWRLQLYPSIREVADPYTGKPHVKRVVLADRIDFTVDLPGLGKQRLDLAPGDYLLTRRGARPFAGESGTVPPYVAPPPAKDVPEIFYREPNVRWEPCATSAYHAVECRIDCDGASDGRFQLALVLDDGSGIGENVVLHPGENRVTLYPDDLRGVNRFRGEFAGVIPTNRVKGIRCSTGEWLWQPLPVPPGKAKIVDWRYVPVRGVRGGTFADNLFEARSAVLQNPGGMESCRLRRCFDDKGRPACRFEVGDFVSSGRYDAAWMRLPVNIADWRAEHPDSTRLKQVVFRARAAFPQTTSFKCALCLADGTKKGFNVKLSPTWREIALPCDVDPGQIVALDIAFGKWLYPKAADRPHAFELESVTLN